MPLKDAEIYFALNTIKQVCKSHKTCPECPLFVKKGPKTVRGSCFLRSEHLGLNPMNWELVKPMPVYKPFKATYENNDDGDDYVIQADDEEQ